jgi:hypothetical protein
MQEKHAMSPPTSSDQRSTTLELALPPQQQQKDIQEKNATTQLTFAVTDKHA